LEYAKENNDVFIAPPLSNDKSNGKKTKVIAEDV